MAKDALPAPMAEKVLKTSGEPFPNARKVTPVCVVMLTKKKRCWSQKHKENVGMIRLFTYHALRQVQLLGNSAKIRA